MRAPVLISFLQASVAVHSSAAGWQLAAVDAGAAPVAGAVLGAGAGGLLRTRQAAAYRSQSAFGSSPEIVPVACIVLDVRMCVNPLGALRIVCARTVVVCTVRVLDARGLAISACCWLHVATRAPPGDLFMHANRNRPYVGPHGHYGAIQGQGQGQALEAPSRGHGMWMAARR